MAELEKVYAQQYGANIYQMAQQRVSKLRNLVSLEKMRGEVAYFERVHPTAAVRRTSKYSDSPMIETKFDRRALHAFEYEWGDMLDWTDDLNLFIDPTSSITAAGAAGIGRVIDDVIIAEGFEGKAYEGKNGTTEVAFPTTQIVAITAGGSSGNQGMNLEKLRQARSLFGKADIDLDDPDNKLYLAITQEQEDDLLRTTEVTSADYNTVKALVNGTINSFMGFEFVKTQRLTLTGTSRNCVAWCKSGIKLALPQEMVMKVTERSDKGFNWYAYAKLKVGCTRIEDTKVVHIPCEEPAKK